MCFVNRHKMVNELLRNAGERLDTVLTRGMIEEVVQSIPDPTAEDMACALVSSEAQISNSAVLISVMAHYAKIVDIKPSFTIRGLKDQFEKAGVLYKRDDIGTVFSGDIIFFNGPNERVTDCVNNVGMVYRSTMNADVEDGRLWIISVNRSNEVCTFVMKGQDPFITHIARPKYTDSNEDILDAVWLSPKRDIELFTNGVPRYYGVVSNISDRDFVYVRMGSGHRYAILPQYSKLHLGTRVAVYDEFMDRTPGCNECWLLIGIDDYHYGYIPKDAVVEVKCNTCYASGAVAMYDTIHFSTGDWYETSDTQICEHKNFEGEGLVVEMNLHSANPYKVCMTNIYSQYKKNDRVNQRITGWIRPEMIKELIPRPVPVTEF